MTEFEYQKHQDRLEREYELRLETCEYCEFALVSLENKKKYCCNDQGGCFDGRDIDTMCTDAERGYCNKWYWESDYE